MPAVSIRPQLKLNLSGVDGSGFSPKRMQRERREVTLSVELTRNPPTDVGSGGGGRSPGNRWERLRQVLLTGVRRPSGVRNLAADTSPTYP
jgi:hypothetical protein